MSIYNLAVLGEPSDEQIYELSAFISKALTNFGLQLGRDIGWFTSADFDVQDISAVVFYGSLTASDEPISTLFHKGIPIVPVVSESERVREEIPAILKSLNCVSYQASKTARIATALLECAGLLPKQRRIFVSYRRNEARAVALQLHEELSAQQFEIFLDTHDIAVAENFQTRLWHELCDSDVLLMLDTENYFESRWTRGEFGRALAKNIPILRLGWHDVKPSSRLQTAIQMELLEKDLDAKTGHLSVEIIEKICTNLEWLRCQGQAMRERYLTSQLQQAVTSIGGEYTGVGSPATAINLPNGKNIIVYTSVRVPSATTLHEAVMKNNVSNYNPVVMYDPIGLHPSHQKHLDWLGEQITQARWLKADNPAWHLADWEI